MKNKLTLKGMWEVLKEAFAGFTAHKVMTLGGSLAYYTMFSMGPLLVMLIALCSLFFGREAVEGKIYSELNNFMGSDTAMQLQDIVRKASISGKSVMAAVIGVVTLLLGATSVFAEIQDGINTVWGIKAKPKKGWLKMLQNRLLSFSVIISLGFLLLVSLSVTALVDAFSNRLQAMYPDVAVFLFYSLNQILTFIVITVIFGVIFKVLPDAKIKWSDILAGSIVTALLFMLGKFAISFYISATNIGSTYGAAGSLVVLISWIYYSSLILYLGAELTRAYAIKYGSDIYPDDYAVTTREVEEEAGHPVERLEKPS